MSQGNVETLREAFAAFERRDKEAFWRLMDDVVEAVPVGEWPEGEIRGREAVWNFFLAVDEPWEPGGYRLEQISESDDRVAARMRRTLRGRSSGIEVEYDYWIVVRFREGRMSRAQWFTERSDALDAAGISG
jgi:ketosteroid isomerase-like protein